MKILRTLNLILAILVVGIAFYHFFIENIHYSAMIFVFLPVMFLLFGIEKIYDKQQKMGYFYITTAAIMFFTVIL
ncbi:hypothetical protein [Lentibacillus sediminis]|uniref:hypothetical protein n=1 Tax=Lentibacillus sediminis TaxID=1940529 RepID=UPI000C1BA40E|nr:hypothetical protein [Lentibacillus sediminis]